MAGVFEPIEPSCHQKILPDHGGHFLFELGFDKGFAGMDLGLNVAGIDLDFVDIGYMLFGEWREFVVIDLDFEPHFEQFLPFQLWFEHQQLLLLALL